MSAPLVAERLAKQLKWQEIDPAALDTLISLARCEDLEGWGLVTPPAQTGDITSRLLPKGADHAIAHLVARNDLVACGLPLVQRILDAYGAHGCFEAAVNDGQSCSSGTVLGTLSGPARILLEAERVLLNFLQRLSGVASLTRTYVVALGDSQTRLLDTRKTTPGYRVLEKYAVACGGGFNHRMGLFDRVMLKDNHLAAAAATGGKQLAQLVESYRASWPDMIIELEVDSIEQIPPALDAGIENLLLDNFSISELKQAVALIGSKAATEASGGITLDDLPELGSAGVDFISTGATVHQARWMDIGLDWS
jgi:nicotinate-nucleotide pyrophosphorylase (carboxylating)